MEAAAAGQAAAALAAEQAAAALFESVDDDEDDDEQHDDIVVLPDDVSSGGPTAERPAEPRADAMRKEMLKSAAEMRQAFSRLFGRHSRTTSAPPELSQLAEVRASLSQKPSEGSPSASSKVEDGASQPPSERDPARLGAIADATGRTGHTAAVARPNTSWKDDVMRTYMAKRGGSTRSMPKDVPVPALTVLQSEIVLCEWEGADWESFSRC